MCVLSTEYSISHPRIHFIIIRIDKKITYERCLNTITNHDVASQNNTCLMVMLASKSYYNQMMLYNDDLLIQTRTHGIQVDDLLVLLE